MKIEFHLLQNFPPSNLNRDDTGAPKDCEFGGHRRQRISSQCLKRATRRSEHFAEAIEGRLGIRTKRAPEAVAKRLVREHGQPEAHARAVAEAFYDALYGVDTDGKTKYLLYVGPEELDQATALLAERFAEAATAADALAEARTRLDEEQKRLRAEKAKGDAAKKALKPFEDAAAEQAKVFSGLAGAYLKAHPGHTFSPDVALFGRMLATRPVQDVDAACQVAHAISVNRVAMDFDYYTAVDDLKPDDTAGADMIGTVGFGSSCFYRYAVVDADLLARNLGSGRLKRRLAWRGRRLRFLHGEGPV